MTENVSLNIEANCCYDFHLIVNSNNLANGNGTVLAIWLLVLSTATVVWLFIL